MTHGSRENEASPPAGFVDMSLQPSDAIRSRDLERASPSESSDGQEAVVVLGYREQEQVFADELQRRMDAGITLYHNSEASHLFLAGGPTPEVGIPESLPMESYALVHGVSPNAIYREESSTSTKENAYYLWQLIESAALPINRLWIVTSAYHQYRAEFVFERTFPDKFGITIGNVCDGEWADSVWETEREKLQAEQEFFTNLQSCTPPAIGDALGTDADVPLSIPE